MKELHNIRRKHKTLTFNIYLADFFLHFETVNITTIKCVDETNPEAFGSDEVFALHAVIVGSNGPVLPKTPYLHGKEGASVQCSYCHMADDHYTVLCPQRAADVRYDPNGIKESDICRARAAKTGQVCKFCQQPGHEGRHHYLAGVDYSESRGQRRR